MHRRKRTFDGAALSALDEPQLGQRHDILMNPLHIASDTPRQLAHRERPVALKRMHQCPASQVEEPR